MRASTSRPAWVLAAAGAVACCILSAHLQAADTNFNWTGHYRPFWGADAGIQGTFNATVHAVLRNDFAAGGAWYRQYSVSSVTFELAFRYMAYAVPPTPVPPMPPPIVEDYSVTLESSDFDLTYHSPPNVAWGGSFVTEAYTPAQGYSLYICLGHPRKRVFATPKGAALVIGGASVTDLGAFVLTVAPGVAGVNGTGQWPSASEFLFPAGYDWAHLPPSYAIPDWPDRWFASECTAFQDDSMWATMSLHRLTVDGLVAEASPDIDAPLVVKPDAKILASMPPLGRGVVADGVTPVLVKIEAHPLITTTYSIAFVPRSGSVDLSKKIKVLSGGLFKSGTTVTLSPTVADAFAYIEGINRQALTRGPNNEVVLEVVLQRGDGATVASESITFRPPPVVLVHGFTGSKNDWKSTFLTQLGVIRPAEFIVRVEYGTYPNSPSGNGTAPLSQCAASLDATLASKLESDTAAASLRKDWAFTRYDIVGYSQGGVIVRYLSLAEGDPPLFTPFRSSHNVWRGRFDRIITLGSPHNGILAEYYLDDLNFEDDWRSDLPMAVYWLRGGHEKFNPSAPGLRHLNNARMDQQARFHAIRSVIFQNRRPNGVNIALYRLLGMYLPAPDGWREANRGEVVLPMGADGVVDFDSQGGGLGTQVTEFEHVAHVPQIKEWSSNPPDAFETGSPQVGLTVATLLDGPESNFGRFFASAPVDNVRDRIRRMFEELGVEFPYCMSGAVIMASKHDVTLLSAPRSRAGVAGPGPSDFSFRLAPIPGDTIRGGVLWIGEHFGSDGVDSDGFTLEVDTNDTRFVRVSVDPSMLGDVVLHAQYANLGNQLVFAKSHRVVSQVGASLTNRLEFSSSNLVLRAGQMVPNPVYCLQSDGGKRVLWLTGDDGAMFASSNTNVLVVNADGFLRAINGGYATLRLDYHGLLAKSEVEVFPPNDPFAEAGSIGQGRTVASNIHATKESGEPNHAGNAGGHSVWFAWTAPTVGTVAIDTVGSDFDTLLAAYQGDSLGRLTTVLSDHGSAGNGASRLMFQATAGTSYAIAVDGANGASGNVTLNVAFPVGEVPFLIRNPTAEGGTFRCAVPTRSGRTYTLEFKDRIHDQDWRGGHTMAGNERTITLTNRMDGIGSRFYRVRGE